MEYKCVSPCVCVCGPSLLPQWPTRSRRRRGSPRGGQARKPRPGGCLPPSLTKASVCSGIMHWESGITGSWILIRFRCTENEMVGWQGWMLQLLLLLLPCWLMTLENPLRMWVCGGREAGSQPSDALQRRSSGREEMYNILSYFIFYLPITCISCWRTLYYRILLLKRVVLYYGKSQTVVSVLEEEAQKCKVDPRHLRLLNSLQQTVSRCPWGVDL